MTSSSLDDDALFVVQAWYELLHPQSPDSFKARVLDLNLLLEDLQHVVDVCGTDQRWAPHLPLLADEIRLALQSEQRVIPPTSQVYRSIETVISDARKGHVHSLMTSIAVAKGLIGSSEQWLIRDLNALIASDPNKKSARIRRLSSLATHVLYRGLGEESTRCISPQLAIGTAQQATNTLLAPLSALPRNFICHVALKGDFNELSKISSASGIARVPSGTLENSGLVSRDWIARNSDRFYVTLNTSALSEYSAAEIALGRMSEILNLQCLHANGATFRASSEVLVKCGVEIQSVEVTPSVHFGLLPRRNATILTIDRYERIKGRISGRLSNALESHSLALGAGDGRTALIFLWTALEAIAGSSDGQPIGRRISSVISPLVAWRRLDKIVTYLAICIQETLAWQGGSANKEYLPRSSFKWVLPRFHGRLG